MSDRHKHVLVTPESIDIYTFQDLAKTGRFTTYLYMAEGRQVIYICRVPRYLTGCATLYVLQVTESLRHMGLSDYI